jgi:hypothetical protein
MDRRLERERLRLRAPRRRFLAQDFYSQSLIPLNSLSPDASPGIHKRSPASRLGHRAIINTACAGPF